MCHKILGFDIACLKQKNNRKGNAFSLQKQPEQIALFAYKDAAPFCRFPLNHFLINYNAG